MIHNTRLEVSGHARIHYERGVYFREALRYFQGAIDPKGDEVALCGYVAALACEKGSGEYEGIGRIFAVAFAEVGSMSAAKAAARASTGFLVILPVFRFAHVERPERTHTELFPTT